MSAAKLVGLYARVSSEQQVKGGTIDSQIAALKERITADGETLSEDLIFMDAGVSGAILLRPELERLRDAAAFGLMDRLYVLAPDRLSRKYAHQVLLMEELVGSGVGVVFLNHTIATTPEGDLLLQMQGMIAEYERAKIMERNRRGKLHGARRGSVNVLGGSPYGYRYVRKQSDGTPASYVVDLEEAKVVRQVFRWVGVDRLSIGEVVRRLDAQGVVTRTGKSHWDRSVVWGMLQNPAYMGRAAFGKTQAIPPRPRLRPQRNGAEVGKRGASTARRSRDQWIEIPVPPLVSEALFLTVQEQLDENRKYARQGRRGAAHLLQGLLICGQCHYAYYGKHVSKSAAKGGNTYAYYRCTGTDAHRFGGQRICDNKQIRTSRLDDWVWTQVVELLNHPERLTAEYERRLDLIEEGRRINIDVSVLERQRNQLETSKSRLIDTYMEGVIDKVDFEPRIGEIKARLTVCLEQIAEAKSQESGQAELFLIVNRLEEFANSVRDRLSTMDFDTKRDIIRALVKRVEIWKDEIVVVFKVDPDPGLGSADPPGTSATGHMPKGKSMQYRPGRTLADAGKYDLGWVGGGTRSALRAEGHAEEGQVQG
jgi:site-specific DNA recombinase